MTHVTAALKMLLFALWCLIAVPFQSAVLLFTKGDAAYILPCLWHKGVCKIFGIRYTITGAPVTDRQTLFMSNHLSYLDIPLIGSFLKASFLAKKDVESWPVFGFLSKLQQTAFIERKQSATAREIESLSQRVQNQRNLILFPEGTSTDGRSVLPFKSSLFTLAMGTGTETLVVQPMTLHLVSVDGKAPETQALRDLYTWHRDMDTPLATHLWLFAKTSGARIDVIFHPALNPADYEDRKTLAKICHEHVSKGLEFLKAA
jgi:1-acyl-sn-glycerol-3-phosphate acyltransferase